MSSSTFEPSTWLRSLADIGCGYALIADRRLAFLVDDCDDEALTHVIGQPHRQEGNCSPGWRAVA